jgi:hypothetical protein
LTLELTYGFSLRNAQVCAQVCRDVYARADIQSPEAHVAITVLDNCILIAFRGTADLRDWLTDADAHYANIKGGSIHKGFLASVGTVFADILDIVDKNPGKPLVITGHSLGGAQAAVAAFRFDSVGIKVACIYTFGQPRWCSPAIARVVDETSDYPYFRVTNAADIVPRIPWLLGRYRHCGEEVFMPDDWRILNISYAPDFETNPSTLAKLFYNGIDLYKEWRRGKLAMLVDHSIDSYIGRIDSYIRRLAA